MTFTTTAEDMHAAASEEITPEEQAERRECQREEREREEREEKVIEQEAARRAIKSIHAQAEELRKSEQWQRENRDNWDEYERKHGRVRLMEVKD